MWRVNWDREAVLHLSESPHEQTSLLQDPENKVLYHYHKTAGTPVHIPYNFPVS